MAKIKNVKKQTVTTTKVSSICLEITREEALWFIAMLDHASDDASLIIEESVLTDKDKCIANDACRSDGGQLVQELMDCIDLEVC